MANFEPRISQDSGMKKEEYYGVGSFILEIIKVVLLAFIIIVPIRVFLFQPFFVQGASMEPNFEDSNYLIINEFGYKKTALKIDGMNFFTVNPFKDLKRGDVIVFRFPQNEEKFFIKRVIGLPGEKVEIKNGQITIFNDAVPNGETLNENAYLASGIKTSGDITTTLKNEEYFVLGDNRMFSSDSRYWGPVKQGEIIGKVLLRAWPLSEVAVY